MYCDFMNYHIMKALRIKNKLGMATIFIFAPRLIFVCFTIYSFYFISLGYFLVAWYLAKINLEEEIIPPNIVNNYGIPLVFMEVLYSLKRRDSIPTIFLV